MGRLIQSVVASLLMMAICQVDTFAATMTVAGNVLANTFMIHTRAGQGTGFALDVDGRQYLITARHMVEGMGSRGDVGIAEFGEGEGINYKSYTMQIFRCSGSVDIAVLIPPTRLSSVETMVPATTAQFFVGQNAYFSGYPLGLHSSREKKRVFPRPIALVKQGLISGVQSDDDGDLILLDGYNIFGFSGSPVTFGEPANGTTPARSYVIGVISGFHPDYGDVRLPKEINRQDIKPADLGEGRIVEMNGKLYRMEDKPSNEKVMLNTGIVHSYSIKAALDLIKLHAIGPIVSQP